MRDERAFRRARLFWVIAILIFFAPFGSPHATAGSWWVLWLIWPPAESEIVPEEMPAPAARGRGNGLRRSAWGIGLGALLLVCWFRHDLLEAPEVRGFLCAVGFAVLMLLGTCSVLERRR